MDDVACVAPELTSESARRRWWEELRRLELLRDRDRLGVGTRQRLVVAREGEEDDEPGEDREARGEHAEHAGRAVSVREEAPLGRTSAHEQDCDDRDRVGD